jgi:predicted phage terminase large subunit-like protein
MNYGACKRAIKEMAEWSQKTWRRVRSATLIENAGYGPELIDDLKRDIRGVTKITVGADGDKVTRAEAASDALESGNVFVPGYGPPWQPAYNEAKSPADIVDFIASCAVFPHGANDDDVDAWSQTMNWLRGRTVGYARGSSILLARR